jgi:hypothetical protein
MVKDKFRDQGNLVSTLWVKNLVDSLLPIRVFLGGFLVRKKCIIKVAIGIIHAFFFIREALSMTKVFSKCFLMETCRRIGVVLFCVYFAVPLYAQEAPAIVQNAVLEGIQFSSEPGKDPGEKVVTCYFIFRDKPSSYFYEVRKKTKKLIFEFNDTQKGTSPIASQKEPPIEGFEIEQKKIDVNKEVKGLNQEWHDLITVTFDLALLPLVHVSDEYNVISFSYKWTTDPLKTKNYVVQDEGKKSVIIWGSAGGVLVLGGALVYILTRPPLPPKEGPLDITDLPNHTQP